mmetsp:Transcript_72599/g.189358  ORF Transcript_72599/g.189358 Transcript_72599/m.189358 type:complete len:229 (-) Transcript_72599:342-1028(-)
MREHDQLLWVGLPASAWLHSTAHDDVALSVQRHQLPPRLHAPVGPLEHHLVDAGIHGHHAVVVERLHSGAARLAGPAGVADGGGGAGTARASVRVEDRNLRVDQIREDVRLERHRLRHDVTAEDNQDQHRVALGQVGDGEVASADAIDLEPELVSHLHGRRELVALLVLHGRTGEPRVAVEHVDGPPVRIGVADAELVRRLRSRGRRPALGRKGLHVVSPALANGAGV